MNAHQAPYDAVIAVLHNYFDGLYGSDTQLLRQAFHPQAMYACATEGRLLQLNLADYLAVVDKRPSPASRGEPRHDRVLSVEFAGPVTALARVECRIGAKHFTDLLTLVRLDGRWSILAKVFHYELA
jgi:hypothetical protein